MKSILLALLLCLATVAQSQAPNNTLRGKVLYQSSGNKPAVGVRIAEPDANPTFSVDNGDYILKFQNKRNGAALALEVGKDDGKSQKLELVNEKEVKGAKLPASVEEVLDIIVCPAGQRDIAAQKYYRILRTTADRELEKKKKEVEGLLAQKEKDYQKISDLFSQLDGMQAALDSSKIREQAFNIASINLDRASQMMKDAVKKIEEENDVEGALKILSVGALDTAYQLASASKRQAEAVIKKADAGIQQVIEGYEFKISLLEQQFKYGEIAQCYEKVAKIFETENYNEEALGDYYASIAFNYHKNGEFDKSLIYNLKSLDIRKKTLPPDHLDLAMSYNNLAWTYGEIGEYKMQLDFNIKSLEIREKVLPKNHPLLALSYSNLAHTYGNLGEIQKQLEYNLKSLEIRQIMPESNQLDLAATYSNLAFTYGKSMDYKKQLYFDLKAIAIRERYLTPIHPTLALSYNNIAQSYGNLGDYDQQLLYNLKACKIQELVLPPVHINLARNYSNIATSYSNIGNFNESLKYNLKAKEIFEKVLANGHPELSIFYSNLGRSYRDNKDYIKGIEYGKKAIELGENSTPKSFYLNRFYANLGITYIKRMQFTEAKTALEKSENLKKEERVYRGWAMYYAVQKNKKKALESLQKAMSLDFKDLKWLETEPDLKNIRKEKGYKEIVEQLKKL